MNNSVNNFKSTCENYQLKSQNEINYLDKMKNEIKTKTKTKTILYTSDSFYKQNHMSSCGYYDAYYKDYQKLIVARPKNMIYLKLVPGALILYKNKIKNYIKNIAVTRLHLDMFLHTFLHKGYEFLHKDQSIGIHPKTEFATFVDLLKYTNMKTLTIDLKDYYCYFDKYKLEYIQRLQYLRQCIQKYCNNVQIIVHLSGKAYECDFWKIANCIKTNNCRKAYIAIKDGEYELYRKKYLGVVINKKYVIMNGNEYCTCKIIRCAKINKTTPNFHRNFKLEERKI